MAIPKKYIHDRLILLLVSVDAFLAILSVVLIALNLGNGHSSGYIVQYRANLGLSAYQSGNASTFYSFMLFTVFVTVLNTILSIRVYRIRRHFSVAILAMTLLLLILVIVVSNALLFNSH